MAEENATQPNKFLLFLKSPKLRLWLSLMGIVVVTAVSVMSLVMILIPADYGLKINLENVRLIQVFNTQQGIKGTTEGKKAYYHEQDDASKNSNLERDSKSVTTVKKILDKVNNSPTKTNRFKQVFLGLGGTEYADSSRGYDTSVSMSSDINRDTISGDGVWIRIFFKTPQYRVWQEGLSYKIAPHDATKPKETWVTSLYIPLGLVEDNYTQQTWYFGLGYNHNNNESDTITTKFVTYGNYYGLFELVADLTAVNFG